jgi:hypothetical protein
MPTFEEGAVDDTFQFYMGRYVLYLKHKLEQELTALQEHKERFPNEELGCVKLNLTVTQAVYLYEWLAADMRGIEGRTEASEAQMLKSILASGEIEEL